MRVRLRGYVKFFVENSLLLILGTTAGLLWANTYFAQYSSVSNPPLVPNPTNCEIV
jgi:hypothetical protein